MLFEGKWNPTPEMFFKAIKWSSCQLFFFLNKTFSVKSYPSRSLEYRLIKQGMRVKLF